MTQTGTAAPAKLTTAQAAALRWLERYTDAALRGENMDWRDERGLRFPNAAMQNKLAAWGYADKSRGMATITDAGRAVLAR